MGNRPGTIEPLGRRGTMGSLKALGLTIGCVLLATCAGVSAPTTPEDIVAQRAQAHLDLLLAEDYARGLEYTTPAYRAGRGLNSYTRSFAGAATWNKADVQSVICEGDRCEVAIEVTYQAYKAGFVNTRSREERWIRVDGSWYLYLK